MKGFDFVGNPSYFTPKDYEGYDSYDSSYDSALLHQGFNKIIEQTCNNCRSQFTPASAEPCEKCCLVVLKKN